MPSIDGIVSGLDTTALIDAIVEAVAGPKYLMEDNLAEAEELQDKVAGITNRLEDMVDAMEAMDEETEFPAFASSLSEEGYVDVTVDSAALPGVYTVEVTALASADTEVSDGFDDRADEGVWGSGDVVIDYGSEQYTITLDGTEDLDAIAEMITDEADGLTAYVMDTGEATGNYRLVIAGKDTGVDNTVDVDVSALAGGTTPTFTESVAAADAEASMNGITVYSSDGVFDDVVQGMAFTALQLTTTPTTITVTRDDTALTEKVQGFVDSYNEVIDYYNANNAYDADEGIHGPFVGDSTVRNLINTLGDMVTGQYAVPDGAFESLAQIGFSTNSNGTLDFDTSEFTDQLDDHYDDVVALFTYDNGDVDADDVGPFAALRDRVADVYINTDGLLDDKQDSIEDNIGDLEDRIAGFEEYLDSYSDRLRDQFTAMEVVLAEIQATQGYLTALFE
jgi:flagellar hook-associated protein 2